MPRFTASQIADIASRRVLGLGNPSELAVRWRLILADPESARLAREIDVHARYLNEHSENHAVRFERLFGRPLSPPAVED